MKSLLGSLPPLLKFRPYTVLDGASKIRVDLPEQLLVEMSFNQSLFVDEWFRQHHVEATIPKMKKLAAHCLPSQVARKRLRND